MTAFDRFEHDLPELMTELAAARVPDYLDDMLRQSARTRQRPWWGALERWIPMGVIARTAPIRQVPWKGIALAALLILALAAALTVYVGSRQRTAPPPFGPANNGSVLITQRGDLLAVDPATGVTRALITGRDQDDGPRYAPDGRSFMFRRSTGEPGIWIAAADGSGARRVFDSTGYDLQTIEWSADGRSIVAMGGDPQLAEVILLIDPAGGAPRTLRPQRDLGNASMPFGRDQLVVREDDNNQSRYSLLDPADPTTLVPLAASAFAINEPQLSPDGNRFVYATWDGRPRHRGQPARVRPRHAEGRPGHERRQRPLPVAGSAVHARRQVHPRQPLGGRWPLHAHPRAGRRRWTGPGDRPEPRPGRRRRRPAGSPPMARPCSRSTTTTASTTARSGRSTWRRARGTSSRGRLPTP